MNINIQDNKLIFNKNNYLLNDSFIENPFMNLNIKNYGFLFPGIYKNSLANTKEEFFTKLVSDEFLILRHLNSSSVTGISFNKRNLMFNNITNNDIQNFITTALNSNYDFDDLMNEQSTKIIEFCVLYNKHMLFCLSGGLDSTSCLYAFIDHKDFYLIKNKFMILMTNDIYIEYPNILNELNKRKIKYNITNDILKYQLNLLMCNVDFVISSGECGGQILDGNSDLLNFKLYSEKEKEKFKTMSIDDFCLKYHNHIPNFIKKLKLWYSKTNLLNFSFLVNNLFKFDFMNYRYLFMLQYYLNINKFNRILNSDVMQNIFYNDKFRHYGIKYWCENIPNINNPKPFMKKYIYKHNNDKEYYLNKKNENSKYHDYNYTIAIYGRVMHPIEKIIVKDIGKYDLGLLFKDIII